MGMLVKITLLLIFAPFMVLCIAFLRLILEDFDAVEIELQQVERGDYQAPSMNTD